MVWWAAPVKGNNRRFKNIIRVLVPHPQLKLVNKFGNLNNIKLTQSKFLRYVVFEKEIV